MRRCFPEQAPRVSRAPTGFECRLAFLPWATQGHVWERGLPRAWGSVCTGTAREALEYWGALGLRAPYFHPFLTCRALPESARWLLARGRVQEAKQVIQKAASANRRKLSPELLSQVLMAGHCLPLI